MIEDSVPLLKPRVCGGGLGEIDSAIGHGEHLAARLVRSELAAETETD